MFTLSLSWVVVTSISLINDMFTLWHVITSISLNNDIVGIGFGCSSGLIRSDPINGRDKGSRSR